MVVWLESVLLALATHTGLPWKAPLEMVLLCVWVALQGVLPGPGLDLRSALVLFSITLSNPTMESSG